MPKQTKAQRPFSTLTEWRGAANLSQQEAADLLEISQSSYARFENRVRFVKGPLAKRIMDRTGVPLEILTGVSL